MEDLFSASERSRRLALAPLAVRMRPTTLDDFVGQQNAVGPGSWLRSAIEHDVLSSVILYGPAGTGKTTLAHIIAAHTRSEFVEVSALTGTVKDLRREIDDASRRLLAYGRRTILFIDEIHRFSRSQQDALLHAVEDRTVIMVGATTENPYFEVNAALLSRSRVVEFEHLSQDDIVSLLTRALNSEKGLRGTYTLDDDALAAIAALAAGDARSALTTLELASEIAASRGGHMQQRAKDTQGMLTKLQPHSEDEADANKSTDACCCDSYPDEPAEDVLRITVEDVQLATPRRGLPYDKDGDMHYDITSAFIKSMRGSDPDAAVYWLARMIDSGEDPKFIARRIMIQAAEDIGNADPTALLVAHAAFRAAEVIGYPECRIPLAQAALYNALAPKSNAAERAIDAALADVRSAPAREVPSYLRDRHRPGSDAYGTYQYPHDAPEGWIDQRYLPEGLQQGAFWHPDGRGWEQWRFEYMAARHHGRPVEDSD